MHLSLDGTTLKYDHKASFTETEVWHTGIGSILHAEVSQIFPVLTLTF